MKNIKLTDSEYFLLRDILEGIATKSLKTSETEGFLGKCEIHIQTQKVFDEIYDLYNKVLVSGYRTI